MEAALSCETSTQQKFTLLEPLKQDKQLNDETLYLNLLDVE
jgi:hypothetical protein